MTLDLVSLIFQKGDSLKIDSQKMSSIVRTMLTTKESLVGSGSTKRAVSKKAAKKTFVTSTYPRRSKDGPLAKIATHAPDAPHSQTAASTHQNPIDLDLQDLVALALSEDMTSKRRILDIRVMSRNFKNGKVLIDLTLDHVPI